MSKSVAAAYEVNENKRYYGGTVTVLGRNLITGLIAGETIEFTRIVVGAGRMPDDVEPIDMTELVSPIAEATSTVPVVDNGVLSMVIEYRNDMNGGLKEGFWLSEFGVYARTEKTNEVLLYYATLGDSPQPVNAYKDNRIDVRRYPISIAVGLDADIQVAYNPGAFITAKDAEQVIGNLVKNTIATAWPIVVKEITIPADGWVDIVGDIGEEDEEPGERGVNILCLHIDVPIDGVTENMQPFVSIHTEYIETAKDCELSTTVQTIEGAIRLYARSAPAVDMFATLTLLCATSFVIDGGVPTNGSAGYSLPTATVTRLGGVKVGDGLNVGPDGTLSVNTDKVVTSEDLVDEAEAAQSVANILNGDVAK